MPDFSSGSSGNGFSGQITDLGQLRQQWQGICQQVTELTQMYDAHSATTPTELAPLLSVVNQLQQTVQTIRQGQAVTQAGKYGGSVPKT